MCTRFSPDVYGFGPLDGAADDTAVDTLRGIAAQRADRITELEIALVERTAELQAERERGALLAAKLDSLSRDLTRAADRMTALTWWVGLAANFGVFASLVRRNGEWFAVLSHYDGGHEFDAASAETPTCAVMALASKRAIVP